MPYSGKEENHFNRKPDNNLKNYGEESFHSPEKQYPKMKLWEKGIKINEQVERFTIGKDRDLDLLIAPFDVLGSLAHSVMLEQSGLLPGNEFRLIPVSYTHLTLPTKRIV